MLELAAYTLFILMAALPALVPVLATVLPLQAAVFAVRGYRIAAVLCVVVAAFCAALAFGPASAVPGGEAFQAMRKTAERQAFAQKMMRSSTFGGTGAPVTIGEIMDVYGEPSSDAGAPKGAPKGAAARRPAMASAHAARG
ncbi:hypothetical protein [Novosphingobium fuchskuhlense]|nr:hypothetical protein [Novosphingobium fuchskuhlense]